ncbi:hypothetical protein BH24PSE2_BH24PSE2_03500 [soil metagenome]
MRIVHTFLCCIAAAMVTAGCEDFPKDPDHTLDYVRGGTLRVGCIEAPPWLLNALLEISWVEQADIRMHEEGHVVSGEAFVVPRRTPTAEMIEDAVRHMCSKHWRAYNFVLVPVKRLEPLEETGS